MKITNKLMSLSLAAAALLAASSCKNSDIEFDDFDYTTVYFANQTPIRTLVLGEDFAADNSLDNKHMCKIGTTFGGAYNGKKITVDVDIDNSLLKNVYFDDKKANPVEAMPQDYYNLKSKQMNFNGGFQGFIEVELTDKFFQDPKCFAVIDPSTHKMGLPDGGYVIPLVIKSQSGCDSILRGAYDHDIHPDAPSRSNAGSWDVAPMDYTLFCINYVNKFSGFWLRSGKDDINGTSNSREVENKFTIDDEVTYLATKGLLKVELTPKYIYDATVGAVAFPVVLTFNGDGNSADCTVSAPEGAAYTVTGTGSFQKGGAGKYWGDRDRDMITLNYTITSGENTFKTTDKLVSQRRGITFNAFSANYIE